MLLTCKLSGLRSAYEALGAGNLRGLGRAVEAVGAVNSKVKAAWGMLMKPPVLLT